jgi:hypothetical protein
MSQNYRRDRVDRNQDNPGNRSQAAALAAAELSRQTQGRSPSRDGAGDVAGQDEARTGRGWDDLSPETLYTDQTPRRPRED